MDFSNTYREEILEYYKEPLNFGMLIDFDATSRQLNPFCGDKIEIFIKYQNSLGVKRKTPLGCMVGCMVSDIRFRGKGCAISMAAASMLTEHVKGKSKEELTKFSEKDMLSMLGINVSETRKKCALLALGVLKDCLDK